MAISDKYRTKSYTCGRYYAYGFGNRHSCVVFFSQFSGSAWLNYDKEFREQAAAERQINWSTMSVQLYNFHTAGAQVRPRVSASSTVTSGQEAEGSKFSKVICHSWNAGRCIAPSTQCRFRHACSTCSDSVEREKNNTGCARIGESSEAEKGEEKKGLWTNHSNTNYALPTQCKIPIGQNLASLNNV
ncbi:hypothetical protein QZH41_000831 [Actinostola sp. cb2023]|nr:hypothetical protein QZH41_000831 [Actinostola sp. cb2023]